MSKYKYEIGGIIRDTEIDFPYHTDEITVLLDEKDQQIADLEAKLAETEKELEIVCVEGKDKVRENIELKQQLAEKEEMIKELSEFILEAKKGTDFLFKQDNKNLREQLAEKDKELEYYKSWFADDDYEKHNQDKISFCIEKLEKVKSLIENVPDEADLYDAYVFQEGMRDSCIKIIDNQIEQLKKEIKEYE